MNVPVPLTSSTNLLALKVLSSHETWTRVRVNNTGPSVYFCLPGNRKSICELISAQNTYHKYNNKDLSRLRLPFVSFCCMHLYFMFTAVSYQMFFH